MDYDIISELSVVIGLTYVFLVVAPYLYSVDTSFYIPFESAFILFIVLMGGSIYYRYGIYGEFVNRLANRVYKKYIKKKRYIRTYNI